MGNANASITQPEVFASEYIDEMYEMVKEADVKDDNGFRARGEYRPRPRRPQGQRPMPTNNANSDDKKKANKILPYAVGAAILGTATADAIKNKSIKAPLEHTREAFKDFGKRYPGIVLENYRGGRIIKKSLSSAKKKFESVLRAEKKQSQKTNQAGSNDAFKQRVRDAVDEAIKDRDDKVTNNGNMMKGMAFGAGMGTGNLAVHMVGDKYFSNKKSDRTVQKSYHSLQDPTVQQYEKKKEQRRREEQALNKAASAIDDMYDMVKYAETCEDLKKKDNIQVEKEAATKFTGYNKDFAKTILHEDIVQNGIKSLPYYAAPLAVGLVINRDIRGTGKKIRDKKGKNINDQVVIEVPLSELNEKKAGYIPYKDFFKYEIPRAAVRSVTWALPATAIAVATGRNIKGTGEKISKDDKMKPVEKGKARIIIETNPDNRDYAYDYDSKSASEFLDGIYKLAKDIPSSDIEKANDKQIVNTTLRDEEKDKEREVRKQTNFHMVQGIKKKQSLNK
jgi:hypothetical protein